MSRIFINRMINGVEIIAEVKTKSPFGFKSKESWDELFSIADKIGDMISIHTDERWGGNYDLIRKARKLTSKLILAKGIHKNDEEVKKAIEAGADFVLVVGRIPKIYREKCLIEVLNLEQFKDIPLGTKAVWNGRDLENRKIKKETFEEAREIWKGWLCQASFIKTWKDVREGTNAILVGENLVNFYKSLKN